MCKGPCHPYQADPDTMCHPSYEAYDMIVSQGCPVNQMKTPSPPGNATWKYLDCYTVLVALGLSEGHELRGMRRGLQFSGAKSTMAGIPLTNTLGENRQFSLQIRFTSCPFNSGLIQYFLSKFAHMHLCGIHYQWLWLNCCKGNSFGHMDAINWDNACRWPDGTSAWPRSLHEPSIHCG